MICEKCHNDREGRYYEFYYGNMKENTFLSHTFKNDFPYDRKIYTTSKTYSVAGSTQMFLCDICVSKQDNRLSGYIFGGFAAFFAISSFALLAFPDSSVKGAAVGGYLAFALAITFILAIPFFRWYQSWRLRKGIRPPYEWGVILAKEKSYHKYSERGYNLLISKVEYEKIKNQS